MKWLIVVAVAVLSGCAVAPEAKEDAKEEATGGHVLDVASMSVYCLVRGKILALVGVDLQGNIQAGACMDPPATTRDVPKGEPGTERNS